MILPTTVDTQVREATPTNNYGALAKLSVNGGGGADDRYSFIHFTRPFPLGSTILTAILRFRLSGAWSGTNDLTVKRVTQKWSESRTNWNNKPTVTATNSAAHTVSSGADKETVEIDVKNMLQDVANGSGQFFGFRIELSQNAVRNIRSAEDPTDTLRPELEVTWSEAPNAPDQLAPDGGTAVSINTPLLRWRFTDRAGDKTQASCRVQIATVNDFTTPEYDTFKIPNDRSMLDLVTNLLLSRSDSDFETSLGSWFNGTNSTPTRDTTQFYQGVASIRLRSLAAGNMNATTGTGLNGFPVTPGQTYTAQARSKAAASARSVQVGINWYDSGGANISIAYGTSVANTTTDWSAYVTHTATAPANAAFAAVRVQVLSTAAANEDHYFDVVMVETGDTASAWQPSYRGILDDGETKYWRVMVWDGTDLASDWSEVATFKRDNLGSLSITSPSGSTVNETSPPIIWSLTGETQESRKVTLYRVEADGSLTDLWNDRATTSYSSVTLPEGLIVTGSNYRVKVEVWDTKDRDADDHVTATKDFTYVRAGGVTTVSGFAATAQAGTPEVLLTWSRSTTPDYWCLRVDGVEVLDFIDPVDTFLGGTSYQLAYWGSKPRTTHNYEIEAVVLSSGVLKHSTSNPTASAKTEPVGIWLVDEDDSTAVQIVGKESAEFEVGESGTTFTLIGSKKPVRITDVVRGYEGPVSGWVLGASERDDFLTLKERDKILTLVVGDVSIPVRLENVKATPTATPGDIIYVVSFNFFQVGPPWPVD